MNVPRMWALVVAGGVVVADRPVGLADHAPEVPAGLASVEEPSVEVGVVVQQVDQGNLGVVRARRRCARARGR